MKENELAIFSLYCLNGGYFSHMQKKTTKLVAVFLCLLMFASTIMPIASVAADWSKLPKGFHLTNETTYNVVGGLTETAFVINNAGLGNQIKSHAMEIDLKNENLSLVAGYNDGDFDGWGRATVLQQAAAMEKKLGKTVVAGINADGFDKEAGVPRGVLVMNGQVGRPLNGRPYFAILKNGDAVIRSGKVALNDVKEAVSGMAIVVKGGKIQVANNDPACHPRTAVGIKADGTIVFFETDGRQIPDSYGMTVYQVAETMIALGCVDALNLDGGGSSTFCTKREADGQFATRNSLAYTTERPVGSTLLVCLNAQSTGEFDHVAFSSNKYQCNASSYVNIDYKGVDKNGYETKIPPNGKLVVKDESFGKISGKRFTAKGKEGTVVVEYVIDGKAVGSTTIEISKSFDNPFVAFFKNIIQTFRNLIQLVKFAFEKIKNGEKY